MPNRYLDTAQRQMREAALDTAESDVLAGGWKSLQMRSIAVRIGVSRQTLYNAFTDKHGLAEALILRLTHRFLDGIEAAVDRADTEHDRWAAVIRYTLATAETEPLLRAALIGADRGEFLPLLTSESTPILLVARERLVAAFLRHHPDLDPRTVADTAETVTRLALSHIVLATQPPARVAQHVADLATALAATR